MSVSDPRRISDVGALKALAHPLRLRLYYALAIRGSATATRLAEQVGESTALVSYHLRALAKHGYVELDPQPRGEDGRERWWRPATTGVVWSPSDFPDGPAEAAATTDAQRQLDAHRAAYRQEWLDSQHEWSRGWRAAAISTDTPLLRMRPAELEEFGVQYAALVRHWHERLGSAVDDSDREQVMVILHAFPFRP